jgi:Carboxypeptidase regulatory-like domain
MHSRAKYPATGGLLSILILLAAPLAGQGLTGQISGNVVDPSGKAINGATIVLVNKDTGQTRVTKTGESGDFLLTEILSGRFNLTVDRAGFKKFEQTGIVLSANERLVLRAIALDLGPVSETVSVEANVAPLQTQSSERSALLDSRQIQELSLKGRDYIALMQLLPGTVDVVATAREAPGLNTLQGLYFNGTRQGSLNLTLDGISTMDTGGGTGPYFEPSIDAVAEVRVLMGNFQAEYGRTSGGAINTIIKNGTKNFHGGLYYYFRNEDLNANEFFNNLNGLARPRYRYNYPGSFVGGPVLLPGTNFNRNRDKLFFFWSEEFLRRDSPTNVSNQTFPTALERTGDFSKTIGQNGQLIVVKDPQTGMPFTGNLIPGTRIDANGQGLLKVFPLPNTTDPTHTFNWVGQSIIEHPRLDEVVRIDWNLSPGTQFYARGILDREATQGGFGYTLASPAFEQLAVNYQIHSEGFASTLIHAFGPTRINELTFGVNRGYALAPALSAATLAANSRKDLHLNLPQFYPQSNPLGVIPNATFGGVSDAPQLNLDPRFPYFGANNVWEYADNYSQIHGAHNMKFGVYVDHAAKNSQLSTFFNGTFAFDRDANNPLDTGYAFANALIGTVDSYTESNSHSVAHARDTSVEWYAQDSWKATRRVTFEAGARFYWIKPTSTGGAPLAAFDPALYNAGQQPPLVRPYIDPATGQRVGRDPVTGQILPAVKIGSFSPAAGTPNSAMRIFNGEILQTPAIQVAPRAGLAWDVFGNGKTAVRTGFGIFYDRFPQNQVTQLQQSPPLVIAPVANYTTISSLLSTPLSLSPSNVFGIQTDYKPPAVYSYSFEIQQSVGFGTVLSVSYVGDAVRHGMQIRNLNATKYGTNFLPSSVDPTLGNRPLPANFLRPRTGYGDIQYMEFVSNSHYNALQVDLKKRVSSRLTFNVAYTWSKVLDVADTPSSVVNPVLDYNSRNYGPAAFDRRQILTINYVYVLPSASQRWNNRFSRTMLDGWELSGISSFISGAPTPINYTFVTATDITGAAGNGIDSRVDLTCNPNLSSGDRTFSRTFNTSCVHPPTLAGLGIGNAPKFPLVGPGVEDFDISLFKNFRLGNSDLRRLQFRFETYNTLNHTQFTAVDNNARFNAAGGQVNQQFGQYIGSAPARRVALGLKLYF